MRKIEVDENGNIFHAYAVNSKKDPNNPEGGLEISEEHADLHEEIIQNLGEYRNLYIYDEKKGLRKRTLSECADEHKEKLKTFKEFPSGFVKKNLDKGRKFKKKGEQP